MPGQSRRDRTTILDCLNSIPLHHQRTEAYQPITALPLINDAGARMVAKDYVMENRIEVLLASIGLAVGGGLGIAGTFAPSDGLRSLAWGIDGAALVMAAVLLAVVHFRRGHDLVAAGFFVFAIGQGLILSGAAMDLARSVPSFAAGAILWSVGLALISAPRIYPGAVRLLGSAASIMLAVTAIQIFGGAMLLPTSSPLPHLAYPVLVATMLGWIWAHWRVLGRATSTA
jgi:hypothetical protein